MSTVAQPTFAEILRTFFKIGCLGFGGPAGQIALMHRILVDEKKWIEESRFLHALNFCMLLPGPEAQQLATYTGWLMHGVRGGIAAGILFVLPGAFVMLGFSLIYALGQGIPLIDGALFGIKAAVLVIVVEALIRIGKRAFKTNRADRDRRHGLYRHFLFRAAVSADRDRRRPGRLSGRAAGAASARDQDRRRLSATGARPMETGGDARS